MKHILTAIFVFICISLPLFSQSGTVWQHQFNLEAGFHMPQGDLKDAYDLENGFGAAIVYYYQLASRTSFLSLSAGISMFKVGLLDRLGIDASLMTLPVMLGYRYNFALSGLQPYVGVEMGFTFISLEDKHPAVGKIDEASLSVQPKAGLRIPLVPQLDFDVNLKYNVLFRDVTFSILGVNAGIAYTIRGGA